MRRTVIFLISSFLLTLPLLAQKKTFRVKNVSFSLVLVEKGTFMMGTDDGEFDEAPAHKVTILKNFYMAETKVSGKLWKAVMGKDSDGYFVNGNAPVMTGWFGLRAFLKKLNMLTGKKFRIPTEAEWEYAARGGNKSKGYLYAGSDNLEEVLKISTDGQDSEHYVLMSGKPNEIGLYGMSGTGNEWCSDWYGANYYAHSPSVDPKGPLTTTNRLFEGKPDPDADHCRRGGELERGEEYCRVYCRQTGSGFCQDWMSCGIRLVLDN